MINTEGHREPTGRFLCDCGNEAVIRTTSVKAGLTQSCGCLFRDRVRESCTTHGMSYTQEYCAWQSVVSRCTRRRNKAFKHYGGRGITVHPDWVGPGGFERFYAHIGPKPGPGYSVDRINNDGNYEPGNVRWATKQSQVNNKRNNRMLVYRGEEDTMANWARRFAMPYKRLVGRIRNGWSVEDALEKPVTGGSDG